MTVLRTTATANWTGLIRYVRSVNLAETSGTARALFLLRNGNDSTNDALLLSIGVPTSGDTTISFAKPLYFPKGVRAELSAGAGALTVDGY